MTELEASEKNTHFLCLTRYSSFVSFFCFLYCVHS